MINARLQRIVYILFIYIYIHIYIYTYRCALASTDILSTGFVVGSLETRHWNVRTGVENLPQNLNAQTVTKQSCVGCFYSECRPIVKEVCCRNLKFCSDRFASGYIFWFCCAPYGHLTALWLGPKAFNWFVLIAYPVHAGPRGLRNGIYSFLRKLGNPEVQVNRVGRKKITGIPGPS